MKPVLLALFFSLFAGYAFVQQNNKLTGGRNFCDNINTIETKRAYDTEFSVDFYSRISKRFKCRLNPVSAALDSKIIVSIFISVYK